MELIADNLLAELCKSPGNNEEANACNDRRKHHLRRVNGAEANHDEAQDHQDPNTQIQNLTLIQCCKYLGGISKLHKQYSITKR